MLVAQNYIFFPFSFHFIPSHVLAPDSSIYELYTLTCLIVFLCCSFSKCKGKVRRRLLTRYTRRNRYFILAGIENIDI